MQRFRKYVSAWLNSSIHDALGQLPVGTGTTAFALITCLDSDEAPASILKRDSELRAALVGARVVDGAILIPAKLLREEVIRDRMFFGFDEIFFFPHHAVSKKPKSARIVGPNRIDEKTLEDLGVWMLSNQCSLAMGDGVGLNFIAKAQGLLMHFLALSMTQAELALPQRHELIEDSQIEDSQRVSR